MKVVTLSEFQSMGLELLDEYINRKYVSATDELVYLRKFQHYISVMREKLGSRVLRTLYHANDSAEFQLLRLRLRLYRGYFEPDKRNGISWSLSRKVAEGFAYVRPPWRQTEGPTSVITGTCSLRKVLAYSNTRKEQELIVDPKDVRDIRNIKVRDQPPFPVEAEPLEQLLRGKQHHGSEVIQID